MSQRAARGLRYVAKLTGGRLAAQLILVLTAVVLPRLLGAEGYGVYAAWMALVALGGGFAALGLPMVETRYLAPMWTLGERGEALVLGATIRRVKLVLAFVAGLAVAAGLTASPRLSGGAGAVVLVGLLAFALYAHEAVTSLFLPVGRVGTLSLFLLLRAALTLPVAVVGFYAGGLAGVAAGLAALYVFLWLLAERVLRSVAPLGRSGFRWGSLRPYAGFALAAFAANLAWRVQGQLSIYALANWVARQEAAYLALALQLYSFLQLLVLSARRALTPVLAEMEEHGEAERLCAWGELVMRWTAAAVTVAALGWALAGGEVIRFVFTEAFAPVHAVAARILLCTLFYGCAESCNMLLYVRGRARQAAVTMTVYTGVTVAGLLVALRGGADGTAGRTAVAYVVAALVYFAVSYRVLARSAGVSLPLGRVLALASPAAAVPLLATWEAPFVPRLAALAGALALYGGLAVVLGLLPRDEWLAVKARLRTVEAPP